jgi:hypothetical protein
LFDIQSASINTAGAYVCLNGYYVFTLGIEPHNGRIPIVRLGGHREGNETGWQCAVREALEEASLRIKPILPPATYLCAGDNLDAELARIQWPHKPEQEPVPFLVVTHRRDEKIILSLMYLAHADGIPAPSSEVKGLILLDGTEIQRLCQGPITLHQYLDSGGRAILKAGFDLSLILEPFAQLRLLSRILSPEPEIKAV